MPETLLQTKLYIPPLRPKLVSRPHLIEQLNQGLQLGHKLTLIAAPAGFGKTTLASEWLASLTTKAVKESDIRIPISEFPRRFAWITLDEGDNDPARFLAYIIAALNQAVGSKTTIGKGALVMLQAPQQPSGPEILTNLINDVTAFPGKIVLTLDDYHVIDSPAVDAALTFLIEHLPPNMHLVIATRDDPQLPLARLRARGQLTELRALDLRFSSAEAAEFLNQVMGLDLSAEDITALEARTEGWIAGLQLAAISMQGQKETAALVKSFTGSHRFVLDYLIEEVLEQQPADVQDFLLQTAVLNRMTGSLCDAVRFGETVRSEGTALTGQEILGMLEHANLFIVPLDEKRQWYRYHHLFADLLRQRLQQQKPDLVPLLQIRASEWYEQNGLIDEAIKQALRAQDFQRAAKLIARVADGAWERGEHGKLRHWLESVPLELVYNNPQFCVYLAWSLLADGELEEARQALQATDHALETIAQDGNQPSNLNMQRLKGKVAATRAFAAFYRGEFPELFRYASQALEYLPQQDLSWRSTATHLVGDAYDFHGDMVQAYPSRVEAVQASKVIGNSYVSLIANLKLAIIMRRRGMLREAIEICEQQMELAAEIGMAQTVLAGWLLAIWGETLAEINDLAGARQKAQMSAERLERDGDLAMIGSSYLGLIRIMFSCGDFASAEEYFHKVERLSRESAMPPWITNLAASWQARIWLVQGKNTAVSSWVSEQELDPVENITYVRETIQVESARFFITQRRLDEADAVLERLLEPAQSFGRTWRVIEILILQALVHQRAGDTDRAITTLEQALTIAEPGGFIRIFVDEGPPMAQLLQKAAARGIMPDYVRRLLSAFPTAEPQQIVPLETHSAIRNPKLVLSEAEASAILEPLSERELEILQLIAVGLTNQQIASRLYLSLNTVKAHTRNIYGKLDVHSRTQAVARARALDILPPA